VGLGFKAGLFNIGGNGQVLVGAFFAALTGAALAQQPVPIALTVAVLAGAIGGALYGFIPGALKAFTGAHEVVVSRNADEMAAHAGSFDLILNTVAAPHDLDAFLVLLKRDGVMTLVGAPATPHPSPNVFNLIMKRRSLAGSMIGGIAETQEMLDFCAEHNLVADIEMIRADEINQAYERMLKGDVKYRFVIDNASLANPQ